MPHLLDIESFSLQRLQALLDLAAQVARKPDAFVNRLQGRVLINLFMEPSTRTRVSFEIAGKRLGMHVINFQPLASSLLKGEALADTLQTLEAMHADVIVIRHSTDGMVAALAATAETAVINAGDGCAHHPTQALLDAVTLTQAHGGVQGLKVLITGDIAHSRVARSDIAIFRKLGAAEIRLAAPAGLLPRQEMQAVRYFNEMDAAIKGVDVVVVLRIQRERFGEHPQPTDQSWFAEWGLTPQRLALATPNCVVLHPGPVNRGVEIDAVVVDGKQSLIQAQVRNGVFTRMAVLLNLLDR